MGHIDHPYKELASTASAASTGDHSYYYIRVFQSSMLGTFFEDNYKILILKDILHGRLTTSGPTFEVTGGRRGHKSA